MGRIGFGHGGQGTSHRLAQLVASTGGHATAASLLPSSAWTGAAGSGFTVTPVDPARTTAKPIVRPIDPPNQYFTDELVYSVMAFANDGGTLIGGIDRVRFHFEGRTVDVVAPTLRTFTRYDGSRYVLPCYTVRLRKPSSTAGVANLYVEAIPADATMQRRVLGPIQFSPATAKHDWVRTIGVTGSGADFQNASLVTATANAVNAARSSAAQNPLLTFISSGATDLPFTGTPYTVQGYLTFECAAGVNVTIGKPGYVNDAGMVIRTRFDGMWFRGRGFTFDMAFTSLIEHEAQNTTGTIENGRSHVFEGVRFTRSTPPGALIRKQLPGGAVSFMVRGSPWFLECDIHNTQRAGNRSFLERGCIFRDNYRDISSAGRCLVGNRIDGHSPARYRTPVNAMTVHYTGPGATATLSMSGVNASNNRVLTARVDGVSVGTFTVQNTEAAFLAGTNYNVSNVVNWINSLGGGWSATLQDDTRYAAALNIGTSTFGAFTNADVRTAPLQLITNWDLHADIYETAIAGDGNVIIYGNSGTAIDAQFILLGGTGNQLLDYAIINNAFSMAVGGSQAGSKSHFEQLHSHVIFAHNTFPNQDLVLRPEAGNNYNPDVYCMVASNSLQSIQWTGTVDTDLLNKNNHVHSGQFSPSPGVGGTQGGTAVTLYVDSTTGDFRPAGDLVSSQKEVVWTWDIGGGSRSRTAPPGAQL